MIINISNDLTYNTETEALSFQEIEIGYVNISCCDKKAEMYIFIEEEYRFHHYATETLNVLIKEYLLKEDIERVVLYVENFNRPALNLMGKLNVQYVYFDEESNEHIYAANKEQFFTKTKEKKEYFDTYDINMNKVNFTWERGKKYPSSLYHIVVSVLIVNKDKTILVTLRNPDKTHPLCYEITTGSVLQGETPRQGAVREVKEEIGITLKESDLIEFGREVIEDMHVLSYVAFLDLDDYHIVLEEDEVVDYALLSFNEFAQIIEHKDFHPLNRKTINNSKKKLNEIISRHFSS
ncbi:MAG: NUDIX domain-containing protein [Bacilli bacterium]